MSNKIKKMKGAGKGKSSGKSAGHARRPDSREQSRRKMSDLKLYERNVSEKKDIFIFLNRNIGEKLTGIESSVLKRYKLFETKLEITPIYLQSNYNIDYPRIIKRLYTDNKVSAAFRYESLYTFFQSFVDNPVVPQSLIKNNDDNEEIMIKDKKKVFSRFFDQETGKLSQVKYYDNNGEIIRIDYFDLDGYLSHGVTFQTESKQILSETYYRRDGSIGIYKHFTKNQEKKVSIERIYVYDKTGNIENVFFNEGQLLPYLLNLYLNHFGKNAHIYLIIERNMQISEVAIKKYPIIPNVKLIPVIHSFHLNDTTDMNSTLRPHRYFLNHLNRIHAVITLTEQQKHDIAERFGDFDNIYCIPHSVEYFPEKVKFSSRTLHKVIALGRLVSEKRYDKMIRIFDRVVKKIPTATLDIYGYGSLNNYLNALIEKLDLTNNIKIYDFTKNVYEKLSNARISLLTSQFEGFSLVILESLACGCPVLSADIRYGPAAMIQNGFNGFLLDADNEETFADKIVAVLSQPEFNQQLSENAYISSQRFSEDNIAELWKNMIKKLSC